MDNILKPLFRAKGGEMKKSWFYFLSAILVFSLVLGGFSVAVAQEKEKSTFTLEEIVVTAERRESNEQDTPVSITAFSATDLDDQSINANIGLQTRLPSTTFTGNKIYIRGVGREMNQVLIDPGVAVYYDGMYVNEQYPINDTFGTERIEVMRGPQDTLYGKSTVGGAINVITKRPTKEFSGQLKARIGTYETRDFQALVSGPVYKDKLMASIVLGHHYTGGFQKNVWDNQYAGAGRDWYSEVRLLFEPTDRLQFYGKWRVSEYYYSNGRGYMNGTTRNPDPWKTTGVLYTSPLTMWHNTQYRRNPNQVNPQIDDPWHFYRIPDNFRNNTDSNLNGGSLLTTLELTDNWTIKWNQDALMWDWRALYNDATDPDYQIAVEDPMWVHGWQQELQVIYGSPDNPISFLGGLYYYNMVENQGYWFEVLKGAKMWGTPTDATFANFLHLTPGNYSTFPPGIPLTDYVPRYKSGFPSPWYYDVTGDTTTQAIYGQLDYQLTKTVNLTLGLRAVKDIKKGFEHVEETGTGYIFDYINIPPPDGGYRPPQVDEWPYRWGILQDVSTIVTHKQDWLEYVGKVGADYKPSEETLIFGKISRGYKAGGFPLGTKQPTPFDPEYVWSYEAGWKQLWLDSRFNTNLAAYYYDYTDMQVTVAHFNPVTGVGIPQVENAEGATNWGIEFEAKGYVIDNLLLEFMYSYMNTRYNEFYSADTTDPDAGLQDLSGNELNRSPKNKFAISATYTVPTNIGDFSLYVNYYWQDETYYRAFNLDIDRAKAWEKTDARIMYFTPDRKWRIALDFNNIFNQPGILDVSIGGEAWTDETTGERIDYRTRNNYIIAPFIASIEVSYSW